MKLPMNWNRINLVFVPGVFLAAACYLFKIGHPFAGGFCLVVATLFTRY